jgi:hypothetical protein
MFEIVFGVLLSVTLGVLLAAVHLVFKPVEVVNKPPEDVVAGQVYLIEGATNGSVARQWVRKRQMLADGSSANVTFNEEELNAWMASVTPQGQKEAAATMQIYTPERVNFRIRDSILQAGVLGKLDVAGIEREMVLQTRGKFVKGAEGFKFTADEFYVGSLPVHMIPYLTQFIVERALTTAELPEDVTDTWKKLELVAVEDNLLRLVLP